MTKLEMIKIKQLASDSRVTLNDSELKYIYAVIDNRVASVSSSMNMSTIEDLTNAESDLVSNQKDLLDAFINWYWVGDKCKECDGRGFPDEYDYETHCENCEGAGYLYTMTFKLDRNETD